MQHPEASTEEILGIIKRVIERENREVAADEKRKRESTKFTSVLRTDAPEEVLDLGEAELVVEGEGDVGRAEPEGLTSNAARQSVNDSFAALAMLGSGDAVAADAQKESPLEGMVREMLRPMLAKWLEEHLPLVVERLVREEIDRIAGKGR